MDNVYSTLTNAAQKWPDNIVVFDEYGELTFSELLTRAELLRGHLVDKGLRPGMGLGVIARNSRYFVIALYAGVGCGAVVMPVSPQQKTIEIENAVSEAGLHMVISDDEGGFGLGKECLNIGVFDQPLFLFKTSRDPESLTAAFIPGAAFMRFTSGTTGKAKGVIVSHKSVIERIDAANEGLRLSEKDRVVWVLPMAYHFIVSITLYIKYGVGIIINNDFLAESIIGSITEHGGTFLYAGPMHIKLLAAHKGSATLPTLSLVITTTTAISAAICRAFEQKYNIPVSQAYGIIEIGLPIINLEKSTEHPDAVGYALPTYDVAILDAEYNPLPDDAEGLLGIKGCGMFDGYLSPPTLREEVLKKGWFMTGDYAVRKNDGLIIIKGREKNMINVSGNKVFSDEVEAVVNTHAGVKFSRVFSRMHPLLGEVVAMEIVTEPGFEIDAESVINHCRKYLSSFKVPQFVVFVGEIALTGSGKVKRGERD